MTKEDKAAIALVTLGIGKDVPLSLEIFQDESIDWRKVFQITVKQQVPMIATDGYNVLKERNIDLSRTIENPEIEMDLLSWIGLNLMVETKYLHNRKAIADLSRFYAKHDISMMLLKGYGLSLYYPLPSHRQSGDIDIYLYGEYKKADRFMAEEMGITPNDDVEHHTTFNFQKILVENHYDFINTKSRRSSKDFEKILKPLANKEKCIKVDGATVYMPSPNLGALFILKHNAAHFSAVGISLRHLLDWAFFVEHETECVDWQMVIAVAREYNMHIFLSCMNDICVELLGFDESIFPKMEKYEEYKEKMLHDLMFAMNMDSDSTKIYRAWRWWKNRWRHKICFRDGLISSFIYAVKSNL